LFTFGRFAFRLIFFGLICNILNITKISVIRLRSKSTRGWSKQDQKYFLYFLFFFFCIFLVSTVKFSVVGRKAEFTPSYRMYTHEFTNFRLKFTKEITLQKVPLNLENFQKFLRMFKKCFRNFTNFVRSEKDEKN